MYWDSSSKIWLWLSILVLYEFIYILLINSGKEYLIVNHENLISIPSQFVNVLELMWYNIYSRKHAVTIKLFSLFIILKICYTYRRGPQSSVSVLLENISQCLGLQVTNYSTVQQPLVHKQVQSMNFRYLPRKKHTRMYWLKRILILYNELSCIHSRHQIYNNCLELKYTFWHNLCRYFFSSLK